MARRDEIGGLSLEKPTKIYLEWSSEHNTFKYYDKEAEQIKYVQLPMHFLWLKEMHTIKGFSDPLQLGIWSNEVADLKTQELIVQTKNGILIKGLYDNIKDKVVGLGGKYCKSIYALDLDTQEIINLQLKGAAGSAYMDFMASCEVGQQGTKAEFKKKNIGSRRVEEVIQIQEVIQAKKGATKYSIPQFSFSQSLPTDLTTLADEKYDIVNNYIKKYLAHSKDIGIEADVVEEIQNNGEDDGLPF